MFLLPPFLRQYFRKSQKRQTRRVFFKDDQLAVRLKEMAVGQQRGEQDVYEDIIAAGMRVLEDKDEYAGIWDALSQREQQVTALTCLGYRSYEIADMLGISYDTVRTHSKHVYAKFGLNRMNCAVLKDWISGMDGYWSLACQLQNLAFYSCARPYLAHSCNHSRNHLNPLPGIFYLSYSWDMDTLPHSLILKSRAPHLLLIETGERPSEGITELFAALALRGPFYAIAGGEWLPTYALARALRRRTAAIQQVLGRVRLARPFTCYQLLDLLTDIRPERDPVLVLDFLHHFHNPDIARHVRQRVEQAAAPGAPLSFFRRCRLRAGSADGGIQSFLRSWKDSRRDPSTAEGA
jgi:hypothetical protein